MKNLVFLFFAILLLTPQLMNAQKERKLQKKFLPKELFKKKLYLGHTKEEMLKKFPEATLEKGTFDFREVYLLGLPYTLAAWTYQNKLILAAAMLSTEWESGFN